MLARMRERMNGSSSACLPKGDRLLAIAWWVMLVLRGVLPAVFAIATGVLVGACRPCDCRSRRPERSRRGRQTSSPARSPSSAAFRLLQGAHALSQGGKRKPRDRTPRGFMTADGGMRRPPGMGHLDEPETDQRI